MTKVIKIALASSVLVAGLGANDVIKGSGASFPYSVYQKWIKAYNKETGIKIDYISEGSGAGIKHIEARQSNFGGSDKPLTPKTLKDRENTREQIKVNQALLKYAETNSLGKRIYSQKEVIELTKCSPTMFRKALKDKNDKAE